MTGEFANLPADLPRPVDDGAAAHLTGMSMPRLTLRSTAARGALYCYPKTGLPGHSMPDGWGRNTRCSRLHAASLRVSQSTPRACRSRRPGLRSEHTIDRLSARNGRAPASSLRDLERLRPSGHDSAPPAGLRGQWGASAQEANSDCQERRDLARVLPRLSARQECR